MLSAFTCAAALWLTGATGSDPALLPGDVAPPFNLVDAKGQALTLRGLVNQDLPEPSRAVVVVFVTTWDSSIDATIKALNTMNKHWSSRDVEVIAIAHEQDPATVAGFAQQRAVDWPIAPDPYGIVGRRYIISSTPHVFVINAGGKIAFEARGGDSALSGADEVLSKLTSEPASGITGGTTTAAGPEIVETVLKFARAPADAKSSQRWERLGIHIGEAVKAQVEMVQKKGYPSFIKSIQEGEFDIFNAGPLICFDAQETYEPIALVEREGNRSYMGIAFVPRASRIRKVSDLRGKTLGLVSPTSTSGGLYPRKLLLDAGLRPSRDVRIQWYGSHAKVANAVKRRWVHAGACFDDCRDLSWKTSLEKVRATRILAYTDEIPGEMIMVKRTLPQELKDSIRQALQAASSRPGLLSQMSKNEVPISDILNATDKDLNAIGPVVDQVRRENRD